jgi:hypothetical protein
VTLAIVVLAAAVGVLAQAWCARRYQAAWSGLSLAGSYAGGVATLSLSAGSWTQGLILVAITSSTLVLVSAGHVERLEDQQWKGHEGSRRSALKRRQRWLLARWVGVLLVCLAIDSALGGLPQ